MDRLNRRQFVQGVAGLGLLAGCGRLPFQAQPPPKTPRVGLLFGAGDSGALSQGLRDLGYVDGHSIVLESRIAAGRLDLLPDLAAELVRLQVDVIVTTGYPATLAAKNATSTIPIVQATGSADLVQEGVVASLARPGGNVTGFTTVSLELTAKRLELLKEAVPGLARVAVLWNPASPATVFSFPETQGAAQALGIRLQSLEVRGPDDLESLLEAATRERADALFLLPDALTVAHQAQIAALAAARRLPSMFDRRAFPAAGGLISYGPDPFDMQRRAATYVDKILKGAKPADLPVERPTKFELEIGRAHV